MTENSTIIIFCQLLGILQNKINFPDVVQSNCLSKYENFSKGP